MNTPDTAAAADHRAAAQAAPAANPQPASQPAPRISHAQLDGEAALAIHDYDRMDPFLMHVASNGDHWLYMGSNGAITAGRRSPAHALFPYYTQDKMFDLARSVGGLTLVRCGDALWEPLRLGEPRPHGVQRHLYKTATGTKLVFEERHAGLGLTLRCLWSTSEQFGIVRRVELENTAAAPVSLEILDGIQNIVPAGLDDAFQNHFSNLADAYKRNELLEPEGAGLYYLNSIPTDRAEPSEGLRCTVVWSHGFGPCKHLLCTRQVEAFRRGEAVQPETETRGLRGAYLLAARRTLAPGECRRWWIAADVEQSAADVLRLRPHMKARDAAAQLQRSIDRTAAHLREIVGAADGLQQSADALRVARHYSNTLYNILRGGTFVHDYDLPTSDLIQTLAHFNKDVHRRHQPWLATLPAHISLNALLAEARKREDPHLLRLVHEYLPLVYARRHGDPSRPWNRFSIQLRDEAGNPRYHYQGNWRDIFQNWEALVHAYPEFAESTAFRFLNASTADGYNPYRVSKEGFDWEVADPDEPWSNIGYWGDHQIIYLLKLLEVSNRHHPAQLAGLLSQRLFAYARVPYHIKPFEAVLRDPRNSIDYNTTEAAGIQERVRAMGADGRLCTTPAGNVHVASLVEKLFVPLLAKLANLVPGGGIWMNTQRPEWNDANNALAGYGLSVVTLAYVHRYIRFLERVLVEDGAPAEADFSVEVAGWLRGQAACLGEAAANTHLAADPHAREAFLRAVGTSASDYRLAIYAEGFSGDVATVAREELMDYLAAARVIVAASLRANERPDRLYHAYNTLAHPREGGLHVHHLDEMLEGQVSVLCAELLEPAEVADLLDALRASHLHTPRRGSYLLYPDKSLPRFLDKNRVPADAARSIPLLARMLDRDDRRVVEVDPEGWVRFNGAFRNSGDLRRRLRGLHDAAYGSLTETDAEPVAKLFDDTFDHRAFTGRSSAFFAYEGLGSIYWHMVSKLVLAIQENHRLALAGGADPHVVARLASHYRETLEGLGIHKNPAAYGAFPNDPYSHTPRHTGAQQPGMTGQVKEDILSRFGELGVHVDDGALGFDPQLLSRAEFLGEAGEFTYFSLGGAWETLPLPQGALAFTYCQVPVVYRLADTPSIELQWSDGSLERRAGATLTRAESTHLFARDGRITRITVHVVLQ